jgi:hypothetical protein
MILFNNLPIYTLVCHVTSSSQVSMSHIFLFASEQRTSPNCKASVTFNNMVIFYSDELLFHHPALNLENHSLSTLYFFVQIFNVFAANTWRPSQSTASG